MVRSKRYTAVATLACAFLFPAALAGHEGHEHVVMGIVQKADGASIDIKTQDEKTKQMKILTVVLNDKTQVLRSGKPTVIADIKIGERIVAKTVMSKDKSGKDVYTAKQVQLADQPTR